MRYSLLLLLVFGFVAFTFADSAAEEENEEESDQKTIEEDPDEINDVMDEPENDEAERRRRDPGLWSRRRRRRSPRQCYKQCSTIYKCQRCHHACKRYPHGSNCNRLICTYGICKTNCKMICQQR
ncbi:uncharacterized protein LOC110244539 [Exaiptasia diaphana]|uniref:Uncharacterized protein n=1 Tax=Exaiptasia diaphana TaxID=2652724 RepID=A0A913XMD5_EXADI|nr:uncharacterized protein LOC110244539 [Exaiptasia diaphana]KXJ10911.1 hypothetical protein AC249_AIPGENE17497 [Exaiptasia diaphana]